MPGSRPRSAAEPFCLAESPPTAHWAPKTWGRGVIRQQVVWLITEMYGRVVVTSAWFKAGGESDPLFLPGLKGKAIPGRSLNGRWRKRSILLSLWHCLSICSLFQPAKHRVKQWRWIWQWIPNQLLSCHLLDGLQKCSFIFFYYSSWTQSIEKKTVELLQTSQKCALWTHTHTYTHKMVKAYRWGRVTRC